MYWEKGDIIQGEQRSKAIRFKQNIILFIFAATVIGIFASFYIDFVTGAAVSIGACFIGLIFKKKKITLVLLFLFLSFSRAYYFEASKGQIKDARNFGIPVKEQSVTEYEFLFQSELEFIRSIPLRVLGDRGAYVAGVMFGDKSNLKKEVTAVFRKAGISHILAVSGLHAGIIMGALCFVFKKVKRKTRLPILYIFLIMLVILSGFSPSVLRAGLMMAIFLFADTFGYRYNLLNSLCLAGTIILLAVPYTLFDVGFLLSFSATLGIALFYPYIYYRLKGFGKYIGGSISMYTACQITSLPIIICVFKEISVLGLLGNLFAVPVVSFALVSGMIGLALYPLGLSYYPFSFSASFMEIIEYIAGAIGRISFSAVSIGAVPVIIVALYYGLIFFMCGFTFNDRKFIYTSLGAVMVFMGLWGLMVL